MDSSPVSRELMKKLPSDLASLEISLARWESQPLMKRRRFLEILESRKLKKGLVYGVHLRSKAIFRDGRALSKQARELAQRCRAVIQGQRLFTGRLKRQNEKLHGELLHLTVENQLYEEQVKVCNGKILRLKSSIKKMRNINMAEPETEEEAFLDYPLEDAMQEVVDPRDPANLVQQQQQQQAVETPQEQLDNEMEKQQVQEHFSHPDTKKESSNEILVYFNAMTEEQTKDQFNDQREAVDTVQHQAPHDQMQEMGEQMADNEQVVDQLDHKSQIHPTVHEEQISTQPKTLAEALMALDFHPTQIRSNAVTSTQIAQDDDKKTTGDNDSLCAQEGQGTHFLIFDQALIKAIDQELEESL